MIAALVAVSVAGCMAGAWGAKRSRPASAGLFLVSLGTLAGVAVPAIATSAGSRESKLTRFGVLSARDVQRILDPALLVLVLSLFAFICGIMLSTRAGPRWRVAFTMGRGVATRFLCLALLLGIGANIALGRRSLIDSDAITSRGTISGAGVLQVLGWLLPFVVIVAIERRRALPSWFAYAASGLGLAVLVGSANRSPLLLVGCFAAVRLFGASGRFRLRRVIAALLIGYAGMILLSGLAMWRGAFIHGTDQTAIEIVRDVAVDPVNYLSAAGGVDTLDGALFSWHLYDVVGERGAISDHGVAMALFVPSQLWSEKPLPYSSRVSQRWLKYGESGMFLSGAGYLLLTSGGPAAAIALWFLIGFAYARAMVAAYRSAAAAALVTYLLVRFWFGGDAYDVFHVASIGGAYYVVRTAARFRLTSRHEVPREGLQSNSKVRRTPSSLASAGSGRR